MLRRSPAFRSPPAASAIEASIDLSRETALAAMMEWVSLYVPTWGTSILLHLAIVILAAFMAVQIQAEPPVPPINFRPVGPPPRPDVRTSTVPRDTVTDDVRYGKSRPALTPVRKRGDPFGNVARGDPRLIDAISTGPNSREFGTFDVGDSTRGTIFEPLATSGSPAKVVYVVDRSGSMTDSFDFVKYELKRSLADLPETSQFHILFYSSGPPMEMSARRLMAATERNRSIAMEFIDSVISTGGTDPVQALERAFAVQPDVIYLLTDGEFDKAIVDHVKRLNVGGRVKVNTIGFLYSPNNEALHAIAAQNGGQYKFVSEEDLAEIVGR
jgi:hypothetical protein